MDRETFDRMFDEAFDAAVRESRPGSASSPEESWERVRKMLEAEKRRRAILRKLSMIVTVVTSLLIGALLFGQAQVTDAFRPFTQFFKEDALSLFRGSSEPTNEGALTAPPPDAGSAPVSGKSGVQSTGSAEEKITVYSFEEAVKLSTAPIFQPENVPEGFKLAYIYLFKGKEKQVSRVYLRYENGEGKYYRYEQNMQSLDSWLSQFFNKEANKLEDIVIGDNEVKVISDAKGKKTLVWTFAAGTLSLSGNIEDSLLMELTMLKK
ncbi:DUF4367 domain-containing protein [Paenibacillus contaminans]|uniref:DUF4367 domain-containing protein n=1 Tax=Paenibacillus contaminans TaxID=450362 RepID=A0A329MNW9_9BACL|nr:DUF4367 domain-containing protein [Paenibacillus contaminans]RAV21158.1 hypothetical protein DQG23_10855 [Paenibacillus contaminans]